MLNKGYEFKNIYGDTYSLSGYKLELTKGHFVINAVAQVRRYKKKAREQVR